MQRKEMYKRMQYNEEKKDCDVVILYESKVREIDSVVLISAELRRRGFSTRIINTFSYQIEKKEKIKTKVVVVPFLYDDLEIYEYVYKICGRVQAIVNLRWEQVFSKDDELNMEYFAYPKNNARKAIHISWSDYLTELLVKSGVDENNVITSGAIQMDFLRKQFRTYFYSRSEISKRYNLPMDSLWKLFVSSFSYTTLGNDELRRYEQNVSNETYEFLDAQIKSKEIILDWFEHKLQKMDGDIIIYRPHPAERNDDRLMNMEKKYCNFRVIRDESFRQWLVVVDEVYNWRSTCIADAYFCDKKSYILRPVKLKESRELPLMKEMKFIEDEEGFNSLNEECCKEEDNHNIQKYYNKRDVPAFITICDKIENILSESEYEQGINYDEILKKVSFKQKIKTHTIYFLYIRLIMFLSKKNICRLKKLKKKSDIFINNIRNIVSDEEIIEMEEKISAVLENSTFVMR